MRFLTERHAFACFQAGGERLQVRDSYTWALVEVAHPHFSRLDQRVHLCWTDVQIPGPLADREEGCGGSARRSSFGLEFDLIGIAAPGCPSIGRVGATGALWA
jgi:hypothetical protein